MGLIQSRLDLQARLEEILGSEAVYYQPPEGYKLAYPCIVYERSSIDTRYADDIPYVARPVYQVTVIHRDPDSDIPEKLAALSGVRFDRHFTSDNLHHTVFTFTIS